MKPQSMESRQFFIIQVLYMMFSPSKTENDKYTFLLLPAWFVYSELVLFLFRSPMRGTTCCSSENCSKNGLLKSKSRPYEAGSQPSPHQHSLQYTTNGLFGE